MPQVPSHRRAQVARFSSEPLQPLAIAAGSQLLVSLLGQRPVGISMTTLELGGVRPDCQPLVDELPDSFQHPAARLSAGVVEFDQAVTGESLEQLKNAVF